MKAEGLQEGVQKKYLLRAVSGTTKSDFVQSDTLDWMVNQMFKFLKKIEFGSPTSVRRWRGLLGSVVQEESECIKEICRATLLVSVGASVGFEFERSKIKAPRILTQNMNYFGRGILVKCLSVTRRFIGEF